MQTFPAPASAIVFEYSWDSLSITAASAAIASFQTFAATNIPPEFGAELVFGKGSSSGQVSFGLTGAFYGASSAFNATLTPYLKTLPKPSRFTITPGSYINSVAVLSGTPLNTSTAADGSDTFYTKSLMTPEGSPMSAAAIKAFVTYMATQGFSSNTVSTCVTHRNTCGILIAFVFSFACCRTGSSRWSCTAGRIPRSTRFL